MFKKIFKSKIHLAHIFIIALFALFEIFLITKNGKVFVSQVDYYKQSIAFADYFRNLFYETGQIFPDFAPHIGAGQNIYYFAYYGLFSPITFFSYLFPFINMLDYMQGIMILNIIASGILMYIFLVKNHFKEDNALIGSLLLLSSCSFLFNSSRHIMFVDYMSFLILALIGVKVYREKNKSTLLICSVFLIIITSYYFSIPCILCLYLYDLYLNMEDKNCTWKKIIMKELNLGLRVLLAILLSSFFLFPIFYTLLSRTKNPINIDILSLITFSIPSDYLFYSQKGIGLNSIVLVTLLFHLLFLKKGGRIVSLFVLFLVGFPLFNYALNGFMYLEAKIFIPLLPILGFLIVNMFENMDRLHWKSYLLLFGISVFSLFFFIDVGDNIKNVLKNLVFNFIVLFLYKNSTKLYKALYLLPIVFLCSKFTINHHWKQENKQVTIETYHIYKDGLLMKDEKFINDSEIYRYQRMGDEYINLSNGKNTFLPSNYSSISSSNYKKIFTTSFYNNFTSRNFSFVAALQNPFFLRFMGIKYNHSDEKIHGYEKLENDLYINEKVFPIGYFRSNLLNQEEYEKLSSIEKLQAYQNNIIIEGESNNDNLVFFHNKISFDVNELLENNFIYKEENHHFTFTTEEKTILYDLKEPIQNQTLIIQFKVNNNPVCGKDEIIKMNGMRNILTCDTYTYHNGNHTFNYVIRGKEINQLKMEITEGYYDVSDIEIYTIDNAFFENIPEVAFAFDKEKTKGDKIEGTIATKEEGYVIFTIPYDKGFTLYVDGALEKIEKVNGGFIGFKVSKGKHNVKLKFTAPYSQVGKMISMFGILCFLCLLYHEKNDLDKAKMQ